MLVLSRHRGQTIFIHNDIVITILAVRGDKVRVGIKAPRSVPVYRGEVFEAKQQESKNKGQDSNE